MIQISFKAQKPWSRSHRNCSKKISIFGALNDNSCAVLLEQSSRIDVARNAFFFREGEGANAFFILEQGHVAVIKDWQGYQFLLSELSEGDCFGEMALIEMHARNASVLALEGCRAIRLGFDSVFKLYKRDLQQFTLLQMNLARELSRRLRDANERLFESRVNPEARMQEPDYPEFSPSYQMSTDGQWNAHGGAFEVSRAREDR